MKIPYPNYPVIYEEEYKAFIRTIDMHIDRVWATMTVYIRYGEKNYNNTIANMKSFMSSRSLESLREAMPEGFTAIIVSSGPSLSNNIRELKKAVGKCLMIAVDSALPILFKEDIQPDIYMCVDANKPGTHFLQERTGRSAVVTILESVPEAIKPKQKVFFERSQNDYINSFFEKEEITLPCFSTGGTVAHDAYFLAEYLGASTIILTGQDLAYTGEKAHADNNLSDNNDIVESTVINTIDIHGNPIRSSREFMIYKDWFEREIRKNREKIKTIDATEGGAYIEGSELMSLCDAISTYCIKDLSFDEVSEQSKSLLTDEEKKRFQIYLSEIPDRLSEIISDAGRSIRNYDKMYLLARTDRMSKGELVRILRENDDISKRLDQNPAMPFVEYFIQDSIKELSLNINQKNRDAKTEIIEASRLGKEHSEAILKGAERVLDDIKPKLDDII